MYVSAIATVLHSNNAKNIIDHGLYGTLSLFLKDKQPKVNPPFHITVLGIKQHPLRHESTVFKSLLN